MQIVEVNGVSTGALQLIQAVSLYRSSMSAWKPKTSSTKCHRYNGHCIPQYSQTGIFPSYCA
eukprot:6139905-Amphidinium_carterae.1